MLACQINNILVTAFSIVTIPLQLVTTFVGGCLVALSGAYRLGIVSADTV